MTTDRPKRLDAAFDGDTRTVHLRSGGTPVARHDGEFTLLVESGDRVDREVLPAWKAAAARAEPGRLVLEGATRLERFTTDLHVSVTYEAVDRRVVKKTIRLLQHNIPRLFVMLSDRLQPAGMPARYWSFDHADHPGGPAYGVLAPDVFPAAGFVLPDGTVVGMLTDSGWENGWSRFGWRRSHLGNLPSPLLSDPALLRTATPEERGAGRHGVTVTFGESYPLHRIALDREDLARGEFAFTGRRGHAYTAVLEARGASSRTLALAGPDGRPRETLGDDHEGQPSIPPSADWSLFTFRTRPLETTGTHTLRLDGPGGSGVVRGLRLFEQPDEPSPWHELRQGRELRWTTFVFADRVPATPRGLRLASQAALAEGLGFAGSDVEKVLFADARMLQWRTEPGLDEPIVVPSIYYFEMYFRDAFWILNGLDDRFLNEAVLGRIGSTMSPDGNIGNIVTVYHGSIEYTHNELAYLYLVWSFLNRRRFGSPPDLDRARKVCAFVRRTFDPDGDGVIRVNNPQCCIDVMWQQRPCRFAVSQGYFAVALRAARELGADVPEAQVAAAEEAYRGYAADDGAGPAFIHTFPDNTLGPGGRPVGIMSVVDLEPEFLSLYLFDRPLLPDALVRGTLDRYPVIGPGLMPLIVKTDGTYFTEASNPFGGRSFWKPGTYANGGSWLRQQCIALAVGFRHEWPRAGQLLRERLEAELSFDHDQPLSREYLACTGDPADSAPHRVFGWNVFVLAVLAWLGWRKTAG